MLTTVEYRTVTKRRPFGRHRSLGHEPLFRRAVDAAAVAAMEASSQAIDLHRCDWLRFRVAIFTNLTQDHLDYHGTMENYFDAKKKLFDGRLGEKPGSCVVNIDDEWGVKLADELRSNGQRVVTFSQSPSNADNQHADLTAENIEVSLLKGTSFLLKSPQGERQITSPLVGRPHVYNMLSAAAARTRLWPRRYRQRARNVSARAGSSVSLTAVTLQWSLTMRTRTMP